MALSSGPVCAKPSVRKEEGIYTATSAQAQTVACKSHIDRDTEFQNSSPSLVCPAVSLSCLPNHLRFPAVPHGLEPSIEALTIAAVRMRNLPPYIVATVVFMRGEGQHE